MFGPDGEFLRRFMPERSRWDSWNRSQHLRPLSVTRSGLILAGQDMIDNDPAEVEVWDADGSLRVSLGAHPGREANRKGEGTPEPVLFGRRTFRQPWGDLFVVSTNHRYEFRAFALDGSLARIVRLDQVPRAPTEAHLEAEIESRVGPGRGEDKVTLRRELRSLPVAEHLPAFAAVRADALDYLWVYEYEAPGEETPGVLFTIFDPEGRVLGYFETPEGIALLEIGADFILGKVRDELGVESVQLWPLER